MDFDKAVKTASPYSKCSHDSLRAIGRSLQRLDAEKIEGDLVECGIWRGGVIILLRLLSPDRLCWLFDTFNGMANISEFDKSKSNYVMPEGKAAVSQYEVAANLAKLYLLHHDRIRFVEGRVEDTLLDEKNLPTKIAFLHLDTDWYYSTKIELEVLWPRLVKGGVLIVDDYGHWKGSKKAVEEYFPPVQRNIIHVDKTAIMMVKA